MIDVIVFPSDYYDCTKVDPDMKREYDAVIATGLFRVVLFDYSSWFEHGRIVLNELPENEMTAVYRGWMMKPDQYREFYQMLQENKLHLITSPEQYEKMHVFPNAYIYAIPVLALPYTLICALVTLSESITRLALKVNAGVVASVQVDDISRYPRSCLESLLIKRSIRKIDVVVTFREHTLRMLANS